MDLTGKTQGNRTGRWRPLIICSLLMLIAVAFPATTKAAVVKAVQSGTLTLSASGTQQVTITSVDPGKSFLILQSRHNSDTPGGSMVRGRILSATQLEFVTVRNDTIEVQWYVVEYLSGVSVQRGIINGQNNTSINVSIGSVPTVQSFVTWSKTPSSGDTLWSEDDPILGYLSSSSNLRFLVTSTNSSHQIWWQVITFTDAADISVQTGTTSMGNGESDKEINLPQAVDESKAFLLVGFRIDNQGNDRAVGRRMLKATLEDNGRKIRFERGRQGEAIPEIGWQVIQLNDGTRVQGGDLTIDSGRLTGSTTITAVDPNRSIAFASVQPVGGQNMGASEYQGDDIIGVASATASLTSNQVTLQRNNSSAEAKFGWYVVEFGGTTTPDPIAEWRMDEVLWNGVSGDVKDQIASYHGTATNGPVTTDTSPAISGTTGTCGYGVFDGSNDYVDLTGLPNLTGSFTITGWIRADTLNGDQRIFADDETNAGGFAFSMSDGGNGKLRFFSRSVSPVIVDTRDVVIATGRWYHVAAVHDATGNTRQIFVNGIAVPLSTGGTASVYSGTWGADPGIASIGGETNASGEGVPNWRFDGNIDEVRVYDNALNTAQINSVMNSTHDCLDRPVAYFPLDEASWNGSAGEVTDVMGNYNNAQALGTAQGTDTTPAKVCRGADIPNNTSDSARYGVDTTIDLNNIGGNGDQGTIAFWYKTNGSWIGGGQRMLFDASPDTLSPAAANKFFHLSLLNSGALQFSIEDDNEDDFIFNSSGQNFGNTDWVYVTVTWDMRNDRREIYVNSSSVGSDTRSTSGGIGDLTTLYLGDNRSNYHYSGSNNSANGVIDEFRLYSTVLTQQQITTLMGLDHPCAATPAIDHFVLQHDGFGINCKTEQVSVSARDSSNAVVSDYAEQITLNTGTGKGTWALTTGTSANFTDATANDGIATYTFDPANAGNAVFSLSYPEGTASFDIDVYQTSDTNLRDDDSEGSITFSASGFVVTTSAVLDPATLNETIAPQTAGNTTTLHLTAYGQTKTHPQCGIIETYNGGKNLKFWTTYNDPVYGGSSAPVRPAVNTIGIDKYEDERALTWPVNFVAGRATINMKYKDVGRIGLNLKDPSVTDPTDLPTGIRGGSQLFVVRPADFLLSNIVNPVDTSPVDCSAIQRTNPAAVDHTGDWFARAGEVFCISVTAIDSGNDATPSYGQENNPEGVELTSTLLAPAGGNDPGLSYSSGFGSFNNGAATGSDFAFTEVGIIQFTPSVADDDYLGTGEVTGTQSGNVGRFTPALFKVEIDDDGDLAAACSSFTYTGQAMNYGARPTLTVTAEYSHNSARGATRNYTGDYSFLGAGEIGLSMPTADATSNGLDGNPLPLVSSLNAGGLLDHGDGTFTYTLAAADNFTYSKNPNARVGPFNADIDIPVAQVLETNDSLADDGNLPTLNPSGVSVRYGRISLGNAHGPELEDLQIPLRVETLNASSVYVEEMADTCSDMALLVSDGSGSDNLTVGANPATSETCIWDTGNNSGFACTGSPPAGKDYTEPVISGGFNLWLQAPGNGNTGTALLAGQVDDWLKYDWDGDGADDDNPTATATFGIYRGNDNLIYLRERY